MRAKLEAELSPLRCNAWPDVTGDVRMLRFLRGFDHDVKQAVKAFRSMLAMRAQHRLDELLAQMLQPDPDAAHKASRRTPRRKADGRDAGPDWTEFVSDARVWRP